MAQVSISEAAKLAGISRSNFYKNYVKQGKISVTRDHLDKPQVDTAELLRVFGALKTDSPALFSETQGVTPENTQGDTQKHTENTHKTHRVTPETHPEDSEANTLKIENRLLREQLAKADEREAWYRQQIGDLTGTLKLLEYQGEKPVVKRRWWRWW